MYAIAGKLLHQIFFPREAARFRHEDMLKRPVFTPLQIVSAGPPRASVYFSVRSQIERFVLCAVFNLNNPPEFSTEDFRQWGREVSLRIALVLKTKVDVDISSVAQSQDEQTLYVLSRAIDRSDDNSAVELYIPLNFFSRLAGISIETDAAAIETSLESIVRDGRFLFPDAPLLLECLDEASLQRLISQLRQSKLLTVYQISLLCLAFPQYAIKIKHALSKNSVKDVSEMMHRIRNDTTFSERDLLIGVYSVEDAIYRFIRAGGDVRYAAYLKELQNLTFELNARETFLLKSFEEWIEEIEREGLLYQVLVRIPDAAIALSFGDETELFEKACGKIFSKRKLGDILKMRNDNATLDDKLRARLEVISAYRAVCVKRKNWGAESFDYIIRGMNDAASLRRLLLETGWFTLSTALKNMRGDVVAHILASFPKPARYLIEDVLRGVLNPNILHDELQIQEARARCVHTALELYEKGLIRIVL